MVLLIEKRIGQEANKAYMKTSPLQIDKCAISVLQYFHISTQFLQ